MSVLALCKFTPLGFETGEYMHVNEDNPRVNLPRWGLKLYGNTSKIMLLLGVNLPRWGLKLMPKGVLVCRSPLCKFTPLGFETKSKRRHARA